jgi:Domain of unknown function (DUF4062)
MRVFLSSTYEDLTEHRAVVAASFAMSNIDYNAMEHFGSVPSPAIRTCLTAVDASDVFVGVLGVRYGGSPPGRIQSYTEREYRRARSRRIPIFMFLIDERNAAVPLLHIVGETAFQQRRLRNLKRLVTRNHTITFFKTPDDLARLILASLIKELGAFP